MRCNRTLTCITIFLSLIAISGSALAEVSIVTDDKGNYVETILLFNEHKGRIYYWEPVRKWVPLYLMLNIAGDMIGDGKPSFAENPLNKQPWVVWSHFNGKDHDIVCSQWDGMMWSAPTRLYNDEYDDIEATISFDASGTPFVAFTRRSETTCIFITSFRNGQWTEPFLVSDPKINCSSPTLMFKKEISVIAFFTPDGVTIIPLDEIGFETNDIEEGPNPLPEFIPGSGNSGTGGGFHGNKEK